MACSEIEGRQVEFNDTMDTVKRHVGVPRSAGDKNTELQFNCKHARNVRLFEEQSMRQAAGEYS
jgi:hypothetical protein